eukprot:TRINITY_DN10025_c0_g1_i1.p1 TRINITY_DN10025_c0_g1~~TRINITY_DN10025_c0_g1_i1.p1  ORF type:complete len:198 (+),score=40.99 TRINITY_DN10025_c0_g1_i1:219-812(+)
MTLLSLQEQVPHQKARGIRMQFQIINLFSNPKKNSTNQAYYQEQRNILQSSSFQSQKKKLNIFSPLKNESQQGLQLTALTSEQTNNNPNIQDKIKTFNRKLAEVQEDFSSSKFSADPYKISLYSINSLNTIKKDLENSQFNKSALKDNSNKKQQTNLTHALQLTSNQNLNNTTTQLLNQKPFGTCLLYTSPSPRDQA